ncbi:hypothetical protein ASPWEDRAFT_175844 [Aspergillus wentii DTO 134E9]|uniref:DJ-1/PfpI domain-containing protein n=1 Tax=Aspergillus wentii DTO 134E9 TaxID=1073089 RepID=A0A1L9RCC5_ASPWE|nr:uncharacterized protein ASPWEDRAFT_175844 [Aspergillus wentii DTO 134E9]KAI9935122.1 hypothetical protein MW887_000743 [Aspergillus wentii]OJJ32564.1 hypothetical protein ASPWEDRAFT_175844 [Aspergillus wentii DTO 134E9]
MILTDLLRVEPLDALGPLDIFNSLSWMNSTDISLINASLDPVNTRSTRAIAANATGQSIVPTHTFSTAPALDVLIVPGGLGMRESTPAVEQAIDFVRDTYPTVKYLITVCTGAGVAAQAGVLDGKRATTNKKAWNEISAMSDAVKWVPHARWVVDGNI